MLREGASQGFCMVIHDQTKKTSPIAFDELITESMPPPGVQTVDLKPFCDSMQFNRGAFRGRVKLHVFPIQQTPLVPKTLPRIFPPFLMI